MMFGLITDVASTVQSRNGAALPVVLWSLSKTFYAMPHQPIRVTRSMMWITKGHTLSPRLTYKRQDPRLGIMTDGAMLGRTLAGPEVIQEPSVVAVFSKHIGWGNLGHPIGP